MGKEFDRRNDRIKYIKRNVTLFSIRKEKKYNRIDRTPNSMLSFLILFIFQAFFTLSNKSDPRKIQYGLPASVCIVCIYVKCVPNLRNP